MESENDSASFDVNIKLDNGEIVHFDSDIISGVSVEGDRTTGFSFGIADIDDVIVNTVAYMQSNMKLIEEQMGIPRDSAVALMLRCAILAAKSLSDTTFDIKVNVIGENGFESPERTMIRNLAAELGIDMDD